MTSRFDDSVSLNLLNPDEQIRCEFRIICDCGGFQSIPAESKGLAKDKLRALGWRFNGDHNQRWLCPKCEERRVSGERAGEQT